MPKIKLNKIRKSEQNSCFQLSFVHFFVFCSSDNDTGYRIKSNYTSETEIKHISADAEIKCISEIVNVVNLRSRDVISPR